MIAWMRTMRIQTFGGHVCPFLTSVVPYLTLLPSERSRDKAIQPEGELSDSEDEGEGGRRDHKSHKRRTSTPLRTELRRTSQTNRGSTGPGAGAGLSVGPGSSHQAAPGIMASVNATADEMDLDDLIPPADGPVKVEAQEPAPTPAAEAPANGSTAVATGTGDVQMSEYETSAAAAGVAPDLNTEAPASAVREERS